MTLDELQKICIEKIELLQLNPGDIFVITSPEPSDDRWLQEAIEKHVGFKVLILSKTKDVEMSVVRFKEGSNDLG
jgi:hypothetical protein